MELWPFPPESRMAVAVAAVIILAALLALLVWRRRSLGERQEREAPTEPVQVVPVEPEPTPPARLGRALAKSREVFRQRLSDVFGKNRELDAMLAALEEALISADVGLPTATRILKMVRARCEGDRNPAEARVRHALSAAIAEALGDGAPLPRTSKPWVILVSGVNGVGKTTSIGKLAARFKAEGSKVLLVAADTFRAAAIDQLGIWAERVGVDVVRHQSGADPAAVAFDGMTAAAARDIDVVLVDTAGRLHTRENLMAELRKVVRVIGKAIPGAPHETLLVLDATTGQNALNQAKVFSQALGVSGIILTKLDGTAKGGAALSVPGELGVPIVYIGVGEGLEDLRPFDAREYAEALIG